MECDVLESLGDRLKFKRKMNEKFILVSIAERRRPFWSGDRCRSDQTCYVVYTAVPKLLEDLCYNRRSNSQPSLA